MNLGSSRFCCIWDERVGPLGAVSESESEARISGPFPDWAEGCIRGDAGGDAGGDAIGNEVGDPAIEDPSGASLRLLDGRSVGYFSFSPFCKPLPPSYQLIIARLFASISIFPLILSTRHLLNCLLKSGEVVFFTPAEWGLLMIIVVLQETG